MRKTDDSIRKVEQLQKNLTQPSFQQRFSDSQSDRSQIDVKDKEANKSANTFTANDFESSPKTSMSKKADTKKVGFGGNNSVEENIDKNPFL